MKKSTKVLACLSAAMMMLSSITYAKTTLYALDGRTIDVEDKDVEAYTAPGMGWFKDEPVTMYAADGRELVVPADQVEAHKSVGWYLKGELKEDETDTSKNENKAPSATDNKEESSVSSNFVKVEYTDGTIVTVPYRYLETYKLLGWVEAGSASGTTVTVYNSNGETKVIERSQLSKYLNAGWTTEKNEKEPGVKYVTLYAHTGETKEFPEDQIELQKANGWYTAYDVAVYEYAVFGNKKDIVGAVELLEKKQYESAFGLVQDALTKLENSGSEYVGMLDYLRSQIIDTWRVAANSPLGFINYWFTVRDGNNFIFIEYRNVSNSRIKYIKVSFDLCDKDGNIIEKANNSYYNENLQMHPYESKKLGWNIKNINNATSIKNLKVLEVIFTDGTSWTASK